MAKAAYPVDSMYYKKNGIWYDVAGYVTNEGVSYPLNEARVIESEIDDVYTQGPTHGCGSNAFFGGVLTKDGKKVILVPYNSSYIGIYDIDTNTFTRGPRHGRAAVSQGHFAEGILADDGKVILIPRSTGRPGIYDPLTNTYCDSSVLLHSSNDAKVYTAIRVADRNILFLNSVTDTGGLRIYSTLYNPLNDSIIRTMSGGTSAVSDFDTGFQPLLYDNVMYLRSSIGSGGGSGDGRPEGAPPNYEYFSLVGFSQTGENAFYFPNQPNDVISSAAGRRIGVYFFYTYISSTQTQNYWPEEFLGHRAGFSERYMQLGEATILFSYNPGRSPFKCYPQKMRTHTVKDGDTIKHNMRWQLCSEIEFIMRAQEDSSIEMYFNSHIVRRGNTCYMIPFDGNRVGRLTNKEFTLSRSEVSQTLNGKLFQGGVILPDNRILMVPLNSPYIGLYGKRNA